MKNEIRQRENKYGNKKKREIEKQHSLHSLDAVASKCDLRRFSLNVSQTLQATLWGHFLPKPRGGSITRNKLYMSL